MSQDKGTDLINNSPDDTLRPSESSSSDTGEAIDTIFRNHLFDEPHDKHPNNIDECDYCRTALQELIRGEVVKELERVPRLQDNAYPGPTLQTEYLVDRIAALSSGQTDGTTGKENKNPWDFVQPCEPDCTPERHAYHQGQWDMAQRMSGSNFPTDGQA